MKLVKLFALTAVSALSAALAVAGDEVGTKRQALGETCSVVATVVQTSGGSGGGCSSSGPTYAIKVTYSLSVQGRKDYRIIPSYINSRDEQVTLPVSGYRTYTGSDGYEYISPTSDDIVTLTASYAADPGRYQVKFAMYNAATGAEVCVAQPVNISSDDFR